MSRASKQQLTRRERRAQARFDRPARVRPHRPAEQRPTWRSPMVLVSAAALLVGGVLIFLALPKGQSGGDGDALHVPPTRYAAELVDGDVLGKADAPVVIQLYADFQCPACQLFVTDRLPRLVDEFVDAGTVRIEAKDIDILGRGTPSESLELAAGARCAAEQDRYWQYHDLVFWNQGRENRGDHDAAFIGRVADAAELDRTAFDACFARPDVREPIRSETAAAARLGVNSTPTLVINGRAVVGVPEYAQLQALIQQLATATAPAS